MARPIVLLTQPIHQAAMDRIAAEAELRIAQDRSEAGLADAITDATALVVRDRISPAVIRAGSKLRLVARHGVGIDYVPVDLCTSRGIPVTITPDANTASVAEWVIGAMVAITHRFEAATRAVREGEWSRRTGLTGIELGGRTLAVVGCGRIGSRVAAIARDALNMKVLGVDPRSDPAALEAIGIVPASLTQALRDADVVSLHVPANAETHRLINRTTIRLMKHGAILVNSARGALVETEALVAALASGQLAGAALDGLEDEPPPDGHALLRCENVLLTPHSAALTEEALRRMGDAVAEEVLRALAGQPPRNAVNSPAPRAPS